MSVREATQVAVEKVHHAAHEWTCSGEHLGGEGERSDERLEGGELDGGATLSLAEGCVELTEALRSTRQGL